MSYAALIPEEFQNELMVISETGNRLSWRIGDITALVIEWNRANENPVGVMEIYSAVGAFIGKASRSIRDYHNVSCFYPDEIRHKPEFSILSFDHFRQAMSLGPEWEKALDWAIEQVDSLGRPASVDAMIAKYMIAPPEIEVGESMDYDDEPAAGGDSPGNQIRAAVLMIRRSMVKMDLDNGTVEQVEEALAVLENLLVKVE